MAARGGLSLLLLKPGSADGDPCDEPTCQCAWHRCGRKECARAHARGAGEWRGMGGRAVGPELLA
jgi:hypothetical protein